MKKNYYFWWNIINFGSRFIIILFDSLWYFLFLVPQINYTTRIKSTLIPLINLYSNINVFFSLWKQKRHPLPGLDHLRENDGRTPPHRLDPRGLAWPGAGRHRSQAQKLPEHGRVGGRACVRRRSPQDPASDLFGRRRRRQHIHLFCHKASQAMLGPRAHTAGGLRGWPFWHHQI